MASGIEPDLAPRHRFGMSCHHNLGEMPRWPRFLVVTFLVAAYLGWSAAIVWISNGIYRLDDADAATTCSSN